MVFNKIYINLEQIQVIQEKKNTRKHYWKFTNN